MRTLILFCLLASLTIAAEPLKVHFIGNSYTSANNLPEMVKKLAATHPDGPQFATSKTTRGGAWLQEHASNAVIRTTLADLNPDWVVLQEQSQMVLLTNVHAKGKRIPSGREFMHAHARVLDATIKEAGARTMFYMTWAREKIPTQTSGLAAAYDDIAKELDARVAPAGLAFAAAKEKGIKLYTKDGSHPNAAGTYLAACCFYAALSGETPTQLDPENKVAKLTPKQAKQLRDIAETICRERGLITP